MYNPIKGLRDKNKGNLSKGRKNYKEKKESGEPRRSNILSTEVSECEKQKRDSRKLSKKEECVTQLTGMSLSHRHCRLKTFL